MMKRRAILIWIYDITRVTGEHKSEIKDEISIRPEEAILVGENLRVMTTFPLKNGKLVKKKNVKELCHVIFDPLDLVRKLYLYPVRKSKNEFAKVFLDNADTVSA